MIILKALSIQVSTPLSEKSTLNPCNRSMLDPGKVSVKKPSTATFSDHIIKTVLRRLFYNTGKAGIQYYAKVSSYPSFFYSLFPRSQNFLLFF